MILSEKLLAVLKSAGCQAASSTTPHSSAPQAAPGTIAPSIPDPNSEPASLPIPVVPYEVIRTEDRLIKAAEVVTSSRHVAIDTETTGLDPFMDRVRLVQLAVPDQSVFVIDLWAFKSANLDPLRAILSSPVLKIFHNAKFDLKFLKKAEFTVTGPFFDTMIARYMMEIGMDSVHPPSLKVLAADYLGWNLPKDLQAADYTGEITSEMAEYAARDAEATRRVFLKLHPELRKQDLVEAAKLEFNCLSAVVEMELNGMLISQEKLDSLRAALHREKESLREQARRELGEFNHNSSIQVLQILKNLNIEAEDTTKDTLKLLSVQHPQVQFILNLRKIDKALSGMVDKYPEEIHPITGRLHPEYRQLGARTGRFSAASPNLQQVDRRSEYRSVFIAPPGHQLVIADYSQIEPRILADLSDDQTMIAALEGDVYREMGGALLHKAPGDVTDMERKKMKVILLGLIYGMGLETMVGNARGLNINDMTTDDAKRIKTQFFKHYKKAGSYIHACYASSGTDATTTASGRKRFFSGDSTPMQRVNSPIQGTAADIMKLALAGLIDDLIPIHGKLIATVHDEAVIEVPDPCVEQAKDIIRTRMVNAAKQYLQRVPIKVSVDSGPDWSAKS